MNKQYIALLYDYTYWARDRLLRGAEGVTQEQFEAPAPFPHGGLRGTLVHLVSSEWVWLSRWQGVSPTGQLRQADFPTLDSIRARWAEEEAKMRAFIDSLSDAGLDRVVHYSNTKGQEFSHPLWQIMMHLANHGTQHRSEAAAILTEIGRSPGDLDMIVYLREGRTRH